MLPAFIADVLPEVEDYYKVDYLKGHPNYLGHGASRVVFREGDRIFKIGYSGATHENSVDYAYSMAYRLGHLTLPPEFAIPDYILHPNGILEGPYIEGADWSDYLVEGGMEYWAAWDFMEEWIKTVGLFDAYGQNVKIDSNGTHWLIDLGAEDGY